MTGKAGNRLNIKELCGIAGVSRSGYYEWLNAEPLRDEREEHDSAEFEKILEAYKFRGYDKGGRGIQMRLLRHDPPINMNLKKIYRLMRKYRLKCPIRKANPYRRMMKALNSIALDFVLETMELLMKQHGSELKTDALLHSDQGGHYTSYKFIELMKDCELRRSMSRRANCWDNAPQESFFGHMKEKIDISSCETNEQIRAVIDDWIDYYNNDRYQWDLSKLAPAEYYQYVLTGNHPQTLPQQQRVDGAKI